MSNIYCPSIHEDLMLDFTEHRKQDLVVYQPCCIMSDPDNETRKIKVPIQNNFFINDPYLKTIREKNEKNEWLTECGQCYNLEKYNMESKRHELVNIRNRKISEGLDFSDKTLLKSLTLTLNSVCDLMCTTCSPQWSSTWLTNTQKSNVKSYVKDEYLRQNANGGSFSNKTIMDFFDNINLTGLQQLIFTGGETVTFDYFEMIDYFISKCNDPTNLSIIFQTNGVRVISEKYLDKLSKLRSVEVSVSTDCIEDKFEYLRRGANWENALNNILYYKQLSIDNKWFYISLEQTISVLSLLYKHQLVDWAKKHDIEYREHLAFDVYSLEAMSNEYIEALMSDQSFAQYIGIAIDTKNTKCMNYFLDHIKWYDETTGSDWRKTFPEIAQFYSNYI